MAVVHGRAGEWTRVRGSVFGLWPLFLCVFVLGFALAMALFAASFALMAFALVLAVAALVGASISLQKGFRCLERFMKGARGEEHVSGILKSLPDAYHVFNGFVAAGRHVDHVVVGPAGVFAVETKFWRGKVTLDGRHVLFDGQLPDRDPIVQVQKKAAAVRAVLAAKGWTGAVTPVLAFASDTFEAKIAEAQGVVVLNANHLLESFSAGGVQLSTAEQTRLAQLMETQE